MCDNRSSSIHRGRVGSGLYGGIHGGGVERGPRLGSTCASTSSLRARGRSERGPGISVIAGGTRGAHLFSPDVKENGSTPSYESRLMRTFV